MTRVFDTFPLGYETDVLLLRLQTLADVVDRFCIVEGDRTFTGQPREALWPMLMHEPEFAPFRDRVSWAWVQLPEHPEVDTSQIGTAYSGPAWQREYVLRGEMLQLVDDAAAREKDIVIISDADEIPNPYAVRNYVAGDHHEVRRLAGHYYQLRLDLRAHGSQEGAMPHYPQLAGHLWEFRQPLIGRRTAFTHAQADRAAMQSSKVTDRAHPGWHFTCMGSNSQIATKLAAYSHTELGSITADDVDGYIRNRRTIGHDVALDQVSIHELPPPIQKDPRAWSHMLAQEVG